MLEWIRPLLDSFVLLQILLVTTVVLLYKWSTSTMDYWKKKKVAYIPPLPLIGNLGRVITNDTNLGYLLKEMCDKKINERFFGFYMTREPVLILNDAELVMQVMLKDFSQFNDKGFHIDNDFDMILNNLFFLKGRQWKFQRNKMSTGFTSGKLKSMYPTIHKCSTSFINHLTKLSKQTDNLELNIKSAIEDLFTDVVCKCILGLDMHSIENPNREYKDIQDATLKPNWRLHVKQVLQFLSPYIDRKIRITGKHIEDWFYGFAEKNMTFRTENKIQRNDFLQTLINIYSEQHNIDAGSEEYFGLRHLAANIFVFIVAGYETSALTTTFFLQKMALYPEIQERLRQEILDVKKSKEDGAFEYEDFKKMTYLSMVLDETLRMYPVLPIYLRRNIVPYTIPGSDVTLDVGTYVLTPTVALHYSSKYWKDPHKFDPERFSEENKDSIVPGSFIPFNEGPRQCIGKRFAHVQMKSAICEILTHFEIQKTPRTVEHTEFVVGSMVMVPKEEIVADFVPRKFY
ncbi:cytochrome P450 6j1-like isoform X1 [Diaphorina citri]|uniref:Cytochrome P450 6j1-like isoform X1 n=1 Tax=Diaphorina citri TaxID=121845 RepID=A0A1S3DAC9_DIACI|nr:cytochrome P450 6j1-like isoform X1 [Diaphorina citri]